MIFKKKYMTLTEILVSLFILSIATSVIMSMFFSAFSNSIEGIDETTIIQQLNFKYSELKTNIKNADDIIISNENFLLKYNDGTDLYYEYKNNILYKDGIPCIKYLKEFTIFKDNNNLISISLVFEKRDIEIIVPFTFYINLKK